MTSFTVLLKYVTKRSIYTVHTPTNALYIELDKILRFSLKSL